MSDDAQRLTVLQAKFAAWLSWSQPFLHALVSGLDPHVRNVVLCNRTENLKRFPVRHVERLPTRYLVTPRLAVLAASYLRRTWQPDLLHAHFGWSGLRLLLLKQMLRIPLVVTFGGRDAGLQMQIADFDRLYRAMLDAADAVVCVSWDLRDKLVKAGVDPERIQVIHRGADLGGFAFVDRAGRPASEPLRALMVGRIVEKKGHRFAFEALAELLREGRDVRLAVVGEGEGFHEVRRLRRRLGLGSRVELLGATDHAGVRARMREADLLVHCSVTPSSGDVEGIPNVVVEAQATGLPVLGTRHGGIAEAVANGESGLLVAERDARELAEAWRRLADRDVRLRMGRAARAFVEKRFALERQIEQHVALYEKAVARAAADPEWKTRNWLPDDYARLMDRTLLARDLRHPSEFSIAELLERLVWARRFEEELEPGAGDDGRAVAAVARSGVFVPEASRIAPRGGGPDDDESRESLFERLYNLKGLVPQSIKFPVKMTLGRVLAWAIEQRYRRRHGAALAALEAADRRVFGFFREGGTLDAWERQAAQRWSPEGLDEAERPVRGED
jgi:glycosyltransferase involved in cell wall biosynthesis